MLGFWQFDSSLSISFKFPVGNIRADVQYANLTRSQVYDGKQKWPVAVIHIQQDKAKHIWVAGMWGLEKLSGYDDASSLPTIGSAQRKRQDLRQSAR